MAHHSYFSIVKSVHQILIEAVWLFAAGKRSKLAEHRVHCDGINTPLSTDVHSKC